MKGDKSTWPNHPPSPTRSQPLLEERKLPKVTVLHTATQEPLWDLIHRYSSIKRFLRTTVICKRFICRLKQGIQVLINQIITPEELLESQRFWIRTVQQQYFGIKLKLLTARKLLPRSNPLVRLCPFMDDHGLLRVKGV